MTIEQKIKRGGAAQAAAATTLEWTKRLTNEN